MKRVILGMCIFLCMFNICFASEIIEDIEKIDEISSDVKLITSDTYQYKTLKGTVIEAGSPYKDSKDEKLMYQDVKVFIDDKNCKATANIKYSLNFYEDTTNYAKPLEVDDKVYVYTTFENGNMIASEIAYKNNTTYLLLIIGLFILVVILIGRMKGLKSLISLLLTIAGIFYVLVPGIMSGKSPLVLTMFISIGIIIITFIIIAGFNRKSLTAIIGTTGGVILSCIFSILFGNLMDLCGMCEETGLLASLSEIAKTFDFKGILFSGIIIGSLGACMDVGMSLASSLNELKEESPKMQKKELIKSGMNIGKDMIGTMTNTLILAYTGGALMTILIFSVGNFNMFEVLNKEIIIEEILRAIAGSIGLICTIPLTTFTAGALYGKINNHKL